MPSAHDTAYNTAALPALEAVFGESYTFTPRNSTTAQGPFTGRITATDGVPDDRGAGLYASYEFFVKGRVSDVASPKPGDKIGFDGNTYIILDLPLSPRSGGLDAWEAHVVREEHVELHSEGLRDGG